tara:strand:+ start:5724 stop:6194 length:471 start_codon:yes stop_codon:yes gene_type:complete
MGKHKDREFRKEESWRSMLKKGTQKDETIMEHYCVDCGFLVDDNGCCGECEEPQPRGKIKSDGGPSGYFDLRNGGTLNDELEHKGDTQWLGDSFHLGNVVKLAWRWGIKSGTEKSYDANKLMYSGARLYMKYAGVTKLRKALQKLLDDPQFKDPTT